MDIYCVHCGESCDIEELHDMPDPSDSRRDLTFSKAKQRFALLGCAAFGSGIEKCDSPMFDSRKTLQMEAAMILSDHVDDWAADCDW